MHSKNTVYFTTKNQFETLFKLHYARARKKREKVAGSFMLEIMLIVVFAAAVLLCLVFTGSVLPALLFGFALFLVYGVAKGSSVFRMLKCAIVGTKSSLSIIVLLLFVGALTATWRASGTMAYMVDLVVRVCPVSLILLMIFLLCSFVSFLVGSAFATASTAGAICAIVAVNAGIPLLYAGGAVLAGAYFGDRCSAVSGSALLVAKLTSTNIKKNMREMVKTSAVPFALTCAFFLALGITCSPAGGFAQAPAYLSTCYVLGAIDILPAVAVLALALAGVPCFVVLGVGAALGGIIAVCVQGCSVYQVLHMCLFGYIAQASGATVLSGGGCVSILSAMAIIFVSSCYVGMFEQSGMLVNIEHAIKKVGEEFGSFLAVALASVFSSICACNQTLAIVLTHELCRKSVPDNNVLAGYLENTVVLLAACVPWSTAVAVPLAAIGAPAGSILFALFLYLVPLYNMAVSLVKAHSHSRRAYRKSRMAATRR